jgi:hypothetical protein
VFNIRERLCNNCRAKPISITHLSVCVWRCAYGCGHVHACSLAYPANNAYVPYCDVICGPSGSNIFTDIIS